MCKYICIYRIICKNNIGIIWILDNITVDKIGLEGQVQSNLQYKGNHTIYIHNNNLTTITIGFDCATIFDMTVI